MNFKQEIKENIIGLATIAGKELTPQALLAFVEALSDLPDEAVLFSLKNWLRTGRGFPFPADIREKIKPEVDASDDAEIVANSIIGAVEACGYTNPRQAEERIGELGWAVVQASGGWRHLCSALTYDNETSFRAQLKNLARAIYKKSLRGELGQPPQLPDHSQEKFLDNREKIKLIAGGIFK